MIVEDVNESNGPNYVQTKNYKMTRELFAKHFREMNKRGKN